MGDFNVVLNYDERMSKAGPNMAKIHQFANYVNNMGQWIYHHLEPFLPSVISRKQMIGSIVRACSNPDIRNFGYHFSLSESDPKTLGYPKTFRLDTWISHIRIQRLCAAKYTILKNNLRE